MDLDINGVIGEGLKPPWRRFISILEGLNSHYFHIVGDGHRPNDKGLYAHYKGSLLKVGWPSPT